MYIYTYIHVYVCVVFVWIYLCSFLNSILFHTLENINNNKKYKIKMASFKKLSCYSTFSCLQITDIKKTRGLNLA